MPKTNLVKPWRLVVAYLGPFFRGTQDPEGSPNFFFVPA